MIERKYTFCYLVYMRDLKLRQCIKGSLQKWAENKVKKNGKTFIKKIVNGHKVNQIA